MFLFLQCPSKVTLIVSFCIFGETLFGSQCGNIKKKNTSSGLACVAAARGLQPSAWLILLGVLKTNTVNVSPHQMLPRRKHPPLENLGDLVALLSTACINPWRCTVKSILKCYEFTARFNRTCNDAACFFVR